MCRPTAGNYPPKKYFEVVYDSGMRSMNSSKTNANLKGTTQLYSCARCLLEYLR